MKRIIVLIIIILASIGGGYYYFNSEIGKTVTIEKLVPSDAVFYYHTDDVLNNWQEVNESSLSNFLFKFDIVKEKASDFDNILTFLPNLKVPLHFSVHKVSKRDFELIYYFNTDISNIEELISIIATKNKWIKSTRHLDGLEIIEYDFNKKPKLNLCIKDGWLIASKNSFLIEEVIKNKSKSPKLNNNSITLFPTNLKDFLSLYFKDKTLFDEFNIETEEIINLKLNFIQDKIQLTGKSKRINEKDSERSSLSFQNYIPMGSSKVFKDGNKIKVNYRSNTFSIVKDKLTREVNDTIFSELYSYPITSQSNVFSYFINDDYYLESTDKEMLESVITAIENEDVWGKSLEMQNFLNSSVDDANSNVYIDFGNYKSLLFENIDDEWKKAVAQNKSNFNSLKYLSIQKSVEESDIIYEWILSLDTNVVNVEKEIKKNNIIEVETLYNHKINILTQPYLVRNHNTSEREIIFQDSLNNVCLLDSKNKLLWSVAVESAILSDIKQIDLFRNGKLQYAFITKNYFYVLDRNGNNVDNYPLNFDDELKYLSIFDYNKDKKYRFLFSFNDGNLLLKDSRGETLEPWSPINLSSKLMFVPQHHRIGSKDVIISITSDNKIHLLNRKGEEYKGFPFLVNIPHIDKYRFIKANNFTNTKIEVFSSNGTTQIINLNGDVVGKSKLKATVIGDYGYSFSGDDFIYTVTGDYNKYIYSSLGDEIIELMSANDEKLSFQYYNFDQNNTLILTSNRRNGELIFNGNRVGDIMTTNPISCIYSSAKKTIKLYSSNINKIERLNIGF